MVCENKLQRVKRIGIFLCGTCFFSIAVGQPQNNNPDSFAISIQQRIAERKLLLPLDEALRAWFDMPSQETVAKCHELALQLIKTDEPSSDAYAFCAKVLEIIGNSQEAITVLDELMVKHPDDNSPGPMSYPVRITANLWKGRLAADLDNYLLAQQAFSDVCQIAETRPFYSMPNLLGTCYEIQAESAQIASGKYKPRFNEDDLNQKYINILSQQMHGFDQIGRLYIEWLFKEGLVSGTRADIERIPPPEGWEYFKMVIDGHLASYGIWFDSIEPLFQKLKGENDYEKQYKIFEIYEKKAKNKLDRILLLFGEAKSLVGMWDVDRAKGVTQQTSNLDKAIQIYNQIITEDPFFAPYADLGIAECLTIMGKEEASTAFSKITERWPTYAKVVEKTKKSVEEKLSQLQNIPRPISSPVTTLSSAQTSTIDIAQLEAQNDLLLSLAIGEGVLILVLIGVAFWFRRKATLVRQS